MLMDSSLLWKMIERMSVAATLAFLLSQFSIFRRMIYRRGNLGEQVAITIVFGLIGILGTYSGIPVGDALANSRVIGVMAAGLIGGPIMGVSAGVIAGGHRYLLGGFTAFSCGLANICEGLLAGMVHRYYPEKIIPWWMALVAGIVGEIMQMAIILLTARPYNLARELVDTIALPMIVVNALGVAIFMLIIKTAMYTQEQVGAEQSHKALDIATKTLPYLRHGLDRQSAQAAAQIIFDAGGYEAVAITDSEQVLAFVGVEAAHHAPDTLGLTISTRQVLSRGEMYIAQSPAEIGCSCTNCKLASGVVVPLKRANQVIGTLKLYYTQAGAVGQADIVFASGVAHLFSTQLELTEIDRQAKLVVRAELKALYAQINPHFLFNTLNTITSLVRTKPDLARGLLIKLGAMFRYTLHKTGRIITINEELAQVHAYLMIEQARHGEKLMIEEDISPLLGKYLIPFLTIQPLVENAIRHGLQPKEHGGRIMIQAMEVDQDIIINIIDDGVGMDVQERCPLTVPSAECIGLSNVHERLRGQYGAGYGLSILSTLGSGTTVTLRIPKKVGDGEDECA
ncbi:MAG: signal transduction histidine kinase, LytS [Firmicutes bacterium]|nr:signal transduction histidine kinase, LytS [Bacillota bacterium]